MFKVLELLKPMTDEWSSGPSLQHRLPRGSGSDRGSGRQDRLVAAAKELQQAWGRSVHCLMQLQARLEMLQDWAVGVHQDGGTLGETRSRMFHVTLSALWVQMATFYVLSIFNEQKLFIVLQKISCLRQVNSFLSSF